MKALDDSLFTKLAPPEHRDDVDKEFCLYSTAVFVNLVCIQDMRLSTDWVYNVVKQVHSLCVDSRPGDRLWTAKGPLLYFC